MQVVSGTLLGQPADVRFTPVGYRWTHSDGAVVEGDGPGATWAALGQREFSPTATSHVYASAGEYTVDLSVVMRAEYRFAGSPWRSISGTLSLAGTPQRVLVGEFDTVLTQGDCLANPAGPGLLTRRPAARRDGRPAIRPRGHWAAARPSATDSR